MKYILLFTFVLSCTYGSEQSYSRGEMLFLSNVCSSCHGPSAKGSRTYPKLANKKQEYLKKKLLDFRSGKSKSVSQQMMAQFAQKLSDQDINDLSFFLSTYKKKELEDVDEDLLGGFGS